MIRNVPPDFLRSEIVHNLKREIKKNIIEYLLKEKTEK